MISDPLLSILIPTVTRHLPFFNELWVDLCKQIEGRRDVELLALVDNRALSIGSKRSTLLNLVRGRWMVFIDSDDLVSPNFIELVTLALQDNLLIDLLLYQTRVFAPDKPDYVCYYDKDISKENRRWEGDPITAYYGPPAHHHVWRSELVKPFAFIDANVGEDFDWVQRVLPLVKTQYKIEQVLYHYRYDTNTSESYKVD
jgi:glycosyltransferase involved in cell wall biosynthesis